MFRNIKFVALGFGAVAVCSLLALAVLSPVSAGTSTGYLPEQIENQGHAIEFAPADAFGDIDVYTSFPKEDGASLLDSTPEMYS